MKSFHVLTWLQTGTPNFGDSGATDHFYILDPMDYQVLSDMSKALILEQDIKCTLSGLCIYSYINIYFTLEAQLFKDDHV